MLYLIYNISYALLSYPAGRISDKVGRKRVLVAGYAIYALVYFGFAQATNLTYIGGLFAVYGVYSALTEGVQTALLVDIAPVHLRGRVIGLHAALVGLALLPASLLDGFLWELIGPQATFYFGSGMGLLAAIGLLFILRDKRLAIPGNTT